MAVRVKKMPIIKYKTPTGLRSSIYPWSDWFDGSVWKLKIGEDFTMALSDFRSMAHAAARRKGKCGVTRSDGEYVWIQFYDKIS